MSLGMGLTGARSTGTELMGMGMELMGAKDVSNYYPSWAEWSNDADTPVVPGKAKEKK